MFEEGEGTACAVFRFCPHSCFLYDRWCRVRPLFGLGSGSLIAIAAVVGLGGFAVFILFVVSVFGLVIVFVALLLLVEVMIVFCSPVGPYEAGSRHHVFDVAGPGIGVGFVDVLIPVIVPIVAVVVPMDMASAGVDVKPMIVFHAAGDQDMLTHGDRDLDPDLLIAELLAAGDRETLRQVQKAVGLHYGEL